MDPQSAEAQAVQDMVPALGPLELLEAGGQKVPVALVGGPGVDVIRVDETRTLCDNPKCLAVVGREGDGAGLESPAYRDGKPGR